MDGCIIIYTLFLSTLWCTKSCVDIMCVNEGSAKQGEAMISRMVHFYLDDESVLLLKNEIKRNGMR